MDYKRFHAFMARVCSDLNHLEKQTVGHPKLNAVAKSLHNEAYNMFAQMPPPSEVPEDMELLIHAAAPNAEPSEAKCWPVLPAHQGK